MVLLDSLALLKTLDVSRNSIAELPSDLGLLTSLVRSVSSTVIFIIGLELMEFLLDS